MARRRRIGESEAPDWLLGARKSSSASLLLSRPATEMRNALAATYSRPLPADFAAFLLHGWFLWTSVFLRLQ